jgi:hypothetical protein
MPVRTPPLREAPLEWRFKKAVADREFHNAGLDREGQAAHERTVRCTNPHLRKLSHRNPNHSARLDGSH